MIQIFINDQATQLERACSLLDLLKTQQQTGVFAVAVNQTFVPASDYDKTPIESGDRIDIVEPMQGG